MSMSGPRIIRPSFHGFDGLAPGVYAAIVDLDGIGPDETGQMRLPYIFNPGGDVSTSEFKVTVGIPS